MKKDWYQGTVLQGDKTGRTIGFPTVNLSPIIIPQDTKKGVHAAFVKINNKQYHGALYFGPRLVKGETHTVLEIFLLDFTGELYDQSVTFTLHTFVREPKHFGSVEEMKKTIKNDVEAVKKILSNIP